VRIAPLFFGGVGQTPTAEGGDYLFADTRVPFGE